MDINYWWIAQTAIGSVLGSGAIGWWLKTTYQARLDRKLEEAKIMLAAHTAKQNVIFSNLQEKRINSLAALYESLSLVKYVLHSLAFESGLLEAKIQRKNLLEMFQSVLNKQEKSRMDLFQHAIFLPSTLQKKIDTFLSHASSMAFKNFSLFEDINKSAFQEIPQNIKEEIIEDYETLNKILEELAEDFRILLSSNQ